MREAISPASSGNSSEEQNVGAEAIPVEYSSVLKEDLKLGVEYLLAKRPPR